MQGVIAHSRLAIVGLGPQGDQPKSDDQFVFAFNGEIYGINAGDSLRHSGFTSDTHCLWLQLQDKSHLQFGSGVNGIWAVASYDDVRRELTLMRDPMGVVPMFVYADRDGLIVSSEVQAISKAVGPLPIDTQGLVESVALRQLSYGRYVKGLDCLQPGEVRRYRLGDGKVELLSSQVSATFLEAHVGLFDTLGGALDNALTKQVEADVPVGLQLSGGVDSTLLAATLARLGHRQLKAFVATASGQGDESNQAIENARGIGIRTPIKVEITRASFSRQVMETLQNYDPAYSHPNFFAIQQIAQEARNEGVKVLLCGEGADEIFRGYTRLLPSNILRLLNAGLSHRMLMAVEKFRLNFDWCASMSVTPLLERNAANNYSWVTDPSMRHLFANYLHELLYRQNIAGMSKSVEVRAPFLDFSVVGFAHSHPKAFFSQKGGKALWLKGQVRRALHDEYPNYEGHSRKSGFALPVHNLLDKEVLAVIERSVIFSKKELGVDRSEWWKRYQRGELNAFEFERTLWPALLTAGALAATGNAL